MVVIDGKNAFHKERPLRDKSRWANDAEMRTPIDELAALAQFMRESRITDERLEGVRADFNDRLLEIATIIDPAAFMTTRRDGENMSASDALGKARRIMELG